ncbi:hypothetical protein B0H13DRAFT_1853209 [Mycena leptocephala]|nr:hypothetical protein B0H13DRAFT_1853209 [Mycena leptocephala]
MENKNGLLLGPCLAGLLELQILLFTYFVDGPSPKLAHCLRHVLGMVKAEKVKHAVLDYPAFLPGHDGEIWIGLQCFKTRFKVGISSLRVAVELYDGVTTVMYHLQLKIGYGLIDTDLCTHSVDDDDDDNDNDDDDDGDEFSECYDSSTECGKVGCLSSLSAPNTSLRRPRSRPPAQITMSPKGNSASARLKPAVRKRVPLLTKKEEGKK